MIGVYVSIKALNKMGLQDRWISILKKKKYVSVKVYASDEEIVEYAKNEVSCSPISNLILSGDITLNSDVQTINEIKLNYSKVLDYPTSVFFLDISKPEALKVQEEYGVICKNENDVDGTELSEDREIVSCKGEKGHNWSEFLGEVKKMPTNALVVSDRYLFSNDKLSGKDARDGRDNLICIVDSILPMSFSFKYDYQVLVLYSQNNCKLEFNELSKEISERITQLRSYPICVEIISLSSYDYLYEETHNRRIITNYHVIRTEHKTNAFKDDTSTCSQVLNWDMIFSKGIIDNSDMPVKSQVVLINTIKEISKYGDGNKMTCGYYYSRNGKCEQDNEHKVIFGRTANRLIVNQEETLYG